MIQHHAARSDLYEFQLEIDGVLVSWVIPRGPSVSPQDRRMARRNGDQPLENTDARESTAEGDDGTGNVTVWDQGTYVNRTSHEMITCLGRGHLSFRLDGEKLYGGYALTRVREGDDETWLLVKRHDDPVEAENRLPGL